MIGPNSGNSNSNDATTQNETRENVTLSMPSSMAQTPSTYTPWNPNVTPSTRPIISISPEVPSQEQHQQQLQQSSSNAIHPIYSGLQLHHHNSHNTPTYVQQNITPYAPTKNFTMPQPFYPWN